MHDVLRHIIICFDPLSVILEQAHITERFEIQGRNLKGPSWAPWLTMPDILFASTSRTFSGISCSVPESSIDYVRQLCSYIGSNAVRFNSPKYPNFRSLRGQDDSCRFEIIWGDVEPDSMQVAQLIEGEWYYAEGNYPHLPYVSNNLTKLLSSGNVSIETDHLVAFGLVDVDEILDGYRLTMPVSYRIPQRNIKGGKLIVDDGNY